MIFNPRVFKGLLIFSNSDSLRQPRPLYFPETVHNSFLLNLVRIPVVFQQRCLNHVSHPLPYNFAQSLHLLHQSEQDDKGIWYIWISILVAPAGCITRWQLSFLNGRMGWFPIGTFLANQCASLLNFFLQVRDFT
jgi:hypothetical protein